MGNLRWQWKLANRGVVTAEIDRATSRESVQQDGRVLSECARGGKPDGHVVAVAPAIAAGLSERPPLEAVVSFDPTLAICVLRVDGHEVGPTAWPVKERKVVEVKPPKPWGTYALFGVLLAGAAVLLFFRLTRPPEPPPPDRSLHGTTRALNGLFIAHYPPEMEAKPAVFPASASGIAIEDKEQRLSIVLAAVPQDSAASHDAWGLQQRLRDEALANVPKGIARFEETARRDERCLGEPGAVVVGRLAHGSSRRARVWSCAFVHEGAGYFVLYSVAEPADDAAEKRARTILDSTELTRLADLGAPPSPSELPSPAEIAK
ncbi:MAG: hypothetical protein KIT84_27570 [Labilithrix sp.]|nr:hypothetical protein [Labilithrix sp.]MCW5814818.1 hypothetical protein [Labilithrix sp.]